MTNSSLVYLQNQKLNHPINREQDFH